MQAALRRTHPVTSGVVRGRLFVSSYAPLFAILAARTCPGIGDPNEHLWPFVTALVLALLGIGDGLWLLRASTHRGAVQVVLHDIQEQGAAVAGYLPAYLLPFIASTPRSTGLWVGYGIYFIVLFTVFLASDFALVNPTLYLFGRRVVRASIDREPSHAGGARYQEEALVEAAHLPKAGETIRLTRLLGCWIEKGGPHGS